MLWSSMEHFRKLDGCLVLASPMREEIKKVAAEEY